MRNARFATWRAASDRDSVLGRLLSEIMTRFPAQICPISSARNRDSTPIDRKWVSRRTRVDGLYAEPLTSGTSDLTLEPLDGASILWMISPTRSLASLAALAHKPTFNHSQTKGINIHVSNNDPERHTRTVRRGQRLWRTTQG